MACLFLFIVTSGRAQHFDFQAQTRADYWRVLDLHFKVERQKSEHSTDRYVSSLAQAIELLLTEDVEKLPAWEDAFERETERKHRGSAEELFVLAERHLQASFVYLKFGREFDAALQLRKAYHTTRDLRKKHPQFTPALKTSGLLKVMLGSVPEKYQWLLSVLDMQGDVAAGLTELETAMQANHILAAEARLWNAFIRGFVLQQPKEALGLLNDPADTLGVTRFLKINLYLKDSQSEQALGLLNELISDQSLDFLPYLVYLKGEVLLHKGEYQSAIENYDRFLEHYKGRNYVKDAFYKKGICLWIMGDQVKAGAVFKTARLAGLETTEADKYAARALQDATPPSVPLIQLRYFTDGGYYQKALSLSSGLSREDLAGGREQVELTYRLARLYHKTGDLPKAILLYHQTINETAASEWYFAPNACLQLGYIALDAGRNDEAKKHFKKALTYRNHEYKNSIDSKAKSALGQLKDLR